MQFHRWWDERLEASRYCQLPVGNLGADLALTMADLFYARLLRHNNHLLWVSRNVAPDLGGAEIDVASEGAVAALYQAAPTFDWASGFTNAADNHGGRQAGTSAIPEAVRGALLGSGFGENPRLVRPGAYRCYCVSIDVGHLAVNTVLNSAHIDDIEDGGFADVDTFDGGDTAPVDDSLACAGPFLILKRLVSNWFYDATTSHNPYADQLLQVGGRAGVVALPGMRRRGCADVVAPTWLPRLPACVDAALASLSFRVRSLDCSTSTGGSCRRCPC